MKTSTAGSTMLLVLSIIATLSACVIGALGYTSAVARHVQRSNTMRQATEVGDGAIDYAFAHWREISRMKPPNVHRPTADFASIPLPTSNLFPSISGFTISRGANPTSGAPFTISNYQVKAVDPQLNDLPSDTTAPPPGTGMTRGTASYYYLASADITLNSVGATPLVVKMRRVFQKEILSPWNYAIFYNDLLEIHPGPDFNVTGWVHTNAKLYTGHKSLKFETKATYGDDWAIGFAPGDGAHTNETPAAPSVPANLPPALEQGHQPFGMDSTRIFNTADTNPNNDSYRELVEKPSSGYADPIADARYYNQAGVRILVDGSNNVTIKNGNDVTLSASSHGRDKKLYEAFSAALSTNQKIQDNREQAEVRLVTLDMSVINHEMTAASGKLKGESFNNVIYISDTSASSTARRGVRLKKGAIMPPGGLTVASDNPVYIQGDYNTGRTSSVETPSNTAGGDPRQNTVPNYIKEPSAVIADAVMVLSNSWSDAASYGDLNTRIASPTTMNVAIVSGIVPSAAGRYSGGAENFVRFMEKWGDSTNFTYYGSMVQLFKSKQNVGYWGKDNVYAAPRRRWYFDTQFYTEPPPGTLSLVSYNKQLWFFK